jgi:hypothetical protein
MGCLPGLNLYFAMSQFDQPHITPKNRNLAKLPKNIGVNFHSVATDYCFGKKSEIL